MRTLILIIALICFTTTYCNAGMRDSILTKRIYRIVDISDTSSAEYYNLKLRPEDADTLFSSALMQLAIDSQINVYDSADSTLSVPLSNVQLMKFFALPKVDTMHVQDPVTGIWLVKLKKYDLSFEHISRYKIMEEWSYNRRSAKTNIRIIAIAPLYEIHDFAGKGIGTPASLWFRYSDIREILKKYSNLFPTKNIPLAIWEDYFSEENK